MAKLIYLRQSGEPRTLEEKQAWFRECAREAQAEGCTFQRHSIHPDDENLTLVEGWDESPSDQGEIRWQFQYAPMSKNP